MRLPRWPFLLTFALLITGGALLAGRLFATPGQVMPRAPFLTVVTLTPGDLCHPAAPNFCTVGVDGQGPFLNFSATVGGALPPVVYTYRPRGLVANTVCQFGDGGIHAMDLFRSMFERWARTGVPGAGGQLWQPGPGMLDHWQKLCFFGGVVSVPMFVEIGSVMPGVGGALPQLTIAADGTGNFEDYQFMFDPQ